MPKNPLLTLNPDLPPPFQDIHLSHMTSAIKQILKENQNTIKEIVKIKDPTWENVMFPLEEIDDRLHQVWAIIGHLNAVKHSPELRKIYHQNSKAISHYATETTQNQKLYKIILKLHQSQTFKKLGKTKQKIIRDQLRDFKLAGIALTGKKKKQFKTLKKTLTHLTTKFNDNVLDATAAWHYETENEKELAGLPAHIIAAAAHRAQQKNKKGFSFTLDFPNYIAVLLHAKNSALRKIFYRAYATRASDQALENKKFDNAPIIQKILVARHKEAKLLGFKNYAEIALQTRMAKNPKTVLRFLNKLHRATKPYIQKEKKALEKFAMQQGFSLPLKPWDITYISEQYQQKCYAISQEALRVYFPLKQVLSGLFKITERLFDVQIKEKINKHVWHESVRYFEIYHKQKNRMGAFYLDLYARPEKRGGAWMDDCRHRRKLKNGSIQWPIAFLNCNFASPLPRKPTLLTHGEVVTLFHEFGHGLHHLLTRVDEGSASGIQGVPWDGVELPSQWMENFCWQAQSLRDIARHYQTKKTLPRILLKKLIRTKNFHAGLFTARQLLFGLFDMQLHAMPHLSNQDRTASLLNRVRAQVEVFKTPAWNRFQNSFSHIFGGGYAAGYYSYKWAEVLSCDTFVRFKKHGVFNKKVSRAFLENILSIGGSEDFMKAYVRFRGRKPTIQALLKDHFSRVATR